MLTDSTNQLPKVTEHPASDAEHLETLKILAQVCFNFKFLETETVIATPDLI